ncbi:CHAP domain-containing protein [Actinomadura sp. PM05-2]|uniref:CHAP domain-containing protein n=2 Tax=Actinomadura parmotrematis TaxID=2864039 RepID=A0ABS7FKF9_9ACTN|nr:CHAP domain-containing protein [Actinomadura parmotrematis]
MAGVAVVTGIGTAAQATVPVPGQDAPRAGAMAAAAAAQASGVQGSAAEQAVKAAQPQDASEQAAAKRPAAKQAASDSAVKSTAKKKPTAQDAIKVAESQVGVKENRSGETKFQDWYMTTQRAKETVRRDGGSIKAYDDAAWCSMFVSWVGNKIGFSGQVGEDAYTVEHAKWFKSQGRWGTTPKPGAVVFFNFDGSKSLNSIEHVGMVIKREGRGTVETVEGNTGNAVQIKTRSADQIVGYGYPDYAK